MKMKKISLINTLKKTFKKKNIVKKKKVVKTKPKVKKVASKIKLKSIRKKK